MLSKWKFFLKYLNKYKLSIITFVISFFIVDNICYSYFANSIYVKVVNNISTLTLKDSIILIIIYSLLLPIYNIFFPIISKFNFSLTTKARKDIEIDLFKKTIGQNIGYFNNNLSGSLSNKISTVARTTVYLIPFGHLNTIFLFIWFLFILCKINIYLAIFSATWFISFVYTSLKLHTNLSKVSKQISEETSKSNGVIVDCFSNIGNIKSFSTELVEFRRLKKQSNNILRNQLKYTKVLNNLQIISVCFITTFVLVSYLFFYYEYKNQNLSLGMFIFLAQLVNQLAVWIRFTGRRIEQIMEGIGKINNGLELLLKEPEVVDNTFNVLQNISGKIVFKNVNFSHKKMEMKNEK